MNVFKMAITGLIVLCFFINISAQETIPEKSKKMKYGIGMGLNYSKYHSTFTHKGESAPSQQEFDPIVGFSLLCSAERTLSDRLKSTLRPEIAFVGSGIKGIDRNLTNVNLLIPISLHARLIDQFYIHGGVGIEYLVGVTAGRDDDPELLTENIDNRWIPSVHGGISYVVSDLVDIGIKYNYGLKSLLEFSATDSEGEIIGSINYKNSYFQFSAILRQ